MNGDSRWELPQRRGRKRTNTVILPEDVKNDFFDDIAEFLDPEAVAWYVEHDLLYRRGYLLHGEPGTGKTSLSLAAAGKFCLDVYAMNLSKVNDTTLNTLMSKLPTRCILLLCFLAERLKRPNIIITSRPSAKAPPNLDLELETIGFDPDQVNEYIEKSFTNRRTAKVDHNKVGNLRSFLQEHWLFWRFVAGLLDRDGQGPEFIKTLEEEPLDLLGPTHQRLVMHCLSETNLSTNRPIWEVLTQELARWLLFECKFNRSARLASAVEFPEVALQTALLDESSDVQERILRSLSFRGAIPRTIVEAVAAWLDDEDGDMRTAAVEALRGQVAYSKHALDEKGSGG